MRLVLAALLLLHGLIHVLGFARAFGLLALPQLTLSISRSMGLLWLLAGVLLAASATSLVVAPRAFWWLGLAAALLSQMLIATVWADAKFGTLANVVALLAALYGAFAWGPFGLRAEYDLLVRTALVDVRDAEPLPRPSAADLARLPEPVQRYLQFTLSTETPQPEGFRARMRGRIRGSATDPWMPFVAEQYNFYDPPRRYFWMEASRAGLPVVGLHAYQSEDARMDVRVLSMFPVVRLRGPELTRTETVTVLNDISIFLPARLLSRDIVWTTLDANTVEATYTVGNNVVRATLVFDAAGALVDFWSDDRPALAADGHGMLAQRWSTPLSRYQAFGPYQLASVGEGRYHAPSGEYAYIELEVLDVTTELTPPVFDLR